MHLHFTSTGKIQDGCAQKCRAAERLKESSVSSSVARKSREEERRKKQHVVPPQKA